MAGCPPEFLMVSMPEIARTWDQSAATKVKAIDLTLHTPWTLDENMDKSSEFDSVMTALKTGFTKASDSSSEFWALPAFLIFWVSYRGSRSLRQDTTSVVVWRADLASASSNDEGFVTTLATTPRALATIFVAVMLLLFLLYFPGQ